jgi:hypothetical protein
MYFPNKFTFVPTTQATLTSIVFDKIDKSEQEKYLNWFDRTSEGK